MPNSTAHNYHMLKFCLACSVNYDHNCMKCNNLIKFVSFIIYHYSLYLRSHFPMNAFNNFWLISGYTQIKFRCYLIWFLSLSHYGKIHLYLSLSFFNSFININVKSTRDKVQSCLTPWFINTDLEVTGIYINTSWCVSVYAFKSLNKI